MDCAEEVSLLRRHLSRQTGIYDLSFDVVQARMVVEFDPARVPAERIRALVARTGMRAEPWQEQTPALAQPFLSRHQRLLSAALSGACLLAGMIAHAVDSGDALASLLPHEESAHGLPPFVILCYLAAILTGFHWAVPRAWASLRNRRPDMNLLVAVSIAGACFLGEWSEGATLAFLFALANLLESWSVARARNAITALLHISPAEATVIHAHGEHRMPVEKVGAGSIIRVKPGERIPCDGEVVAGESSVNQALITGESVPAGKAAGSRVYAGTINGDGALDVRTTRAFRDTTLARIVRMVESSTQRRAPSEQFVERFARYYTPAVFALAALIMLLPPLFHAGAWSHWFYQGMVILLISCPCALVISTPVSIVSAIASAARRGVLFKGGAFLEAAARLDALAFDKTGVLTEGAPEVERFFVFDGRSESEVLARLAGIELRSEHPLGRAIVRYAAASGVEPAAVAHFQALPGRGAEGQIGADTFWSGSSRLLAEKNADGLGLRERLAELAGSAHTAVICGAGERVWAIAGIRDKVKPEAAGALAALRRLGVENLVMFTGDNAATARAVAQELGITDFRSDFLPEEKAAAIAELRRTSKSVALVGDGINDAEAMAAASVGIALGNRAADVALETADVVLMSGDLRKLPFLIRHARRTAAVIRQNVLIALALKAAFLVAAMAGAATLWMAVAADMGATLLVTFNGLRLLRAVETPGDK